MKTQMKTLTIIALALSLAACGGGGSSSPSPVINVPVLNVPIPPVGNVPAKPFTGAFLAIEGQSIGYVAGTSPKDSVERLMALVIAEPVKYAPMYKLLLSDAGLRVAVFGESIGTGGVSGLPIYAPDMQFVVKLTASGLVITGL